MLSIIFVIAAVCLFAVSAVVYMANNLYWVVAMAYAITGAAFIIASAVCFIIFKTGANKKSSLIADGKYVMAEIVDIDVDVYRKIHYNTVSMHPYFILCRYTDEEGRSYTFRSRSLLYNPSGLLKDGWLKVYVDLSKPSKYYVDTSSILPDDAVLHKFRNDTEKNGRRLVKSGQYIEAVTCGVEHIGRIRLSGALGTGFLTLSENAAKKLKLGLDDKSRAFWGYTILCRYDAPDGTPHVFASRRIAGEPKSDYMGQKVKVYHRGKEYSYYHVDTSALIGE